MNFKRNLIIILLLSGLLLLVGCGRQGSKVAEDVPIKPEVDFRAPDFTLTNLAGNEVSLFDFVGEKIVFINFWASWCPPCRAEMPYIQQIHENNKDKVKVLTVNLRESRQKVNEFVENNDYNFTVLLDKKGEIAQNYLVRGVPKTFVVDKNGIIKAKHVGSMTKEQMNKLINEASQ